MSLVGQVRHLSEKLSEAKLSIEGALAQLKSAEQKAIRHDRLASLGKMTGGVVHDLNNALTPVVTAAYLLEPDHITDERKEALALIRGGTDHVLKILKQLQHFYASDAPFDQPVEIVSLSEVVSRAVQLTRFQWHDDARKRGVVFQVNTEVPDEFSIAANATELLQVFTNLILNAIDAMPAGGSVNIEAAEVGNSIRIVVSDEGTGISPNDQAHCFEPFFTTKKAGSGMGLFICKSVVERYGGTLTLESESKKGSRFALLFPRPGATQERPAIANQKRILILDDDELVRNSLSLLVESLGYTADIAEPNQFDPQSATEAGYVLALIDSNVFSSRGEEIAALRADSPSTPIVVITGWSTSEVEGMLRDDGRTPDLILEKPIGSGELRDCLLRFDLVQDESDPSLADDD